MRLLRRMCSPVLMLLMMACGEHDAPAVSELAFPLKALEGRWEDTNRENAFYEEWSIRADFELEGRGYVIAVGDTVFIEQLEIIPEGEALYYVVGLSSTQQVEPVRFKMTSADSKQITFEKPDHDFPKLINYTLADENRLEVYLNGHEAGDYTEIRFSFRRRP